MAQLFNIPQYLQHEMDFESACNVINRLTAKETLLEGLEYMDKQWKHYQETYGTCACQFEYDTDFYEYWEYEINAFNVVYNKMAPLFQ